MSHHRHVYQQGEHDAQPPCFRELLLSASRSNGDSGGALKLAVESGLVKKPSGTLGLGLVKNPSGTETG
jgi:hypothetical protein